MYKQFKNQKHFRQLVTKCCEVRVRLLTRNESGLTDWWVKVEKKEIGEIFSLSDKLPSRDPLKRIEYHLQTHLLPKGGVLYIQEIKEKTFFNFKKK